MPKKPYKGVTETFSGRHKRRLLDRDLGNVQDDEVVDDNITVDIAPQEEVGTDEPSDVYLECEGGDERNLEPEETPIEEFHDALNAEQFDAEFNFCDVDGDEEYFMNLEFEDPESDEEDIFEEVQAEFYIDNFKVELAQWAATGVTKTKTSDLLKLLQTHPDFSTLPADARTLLSTPRVTEISKVGNGENVHFGAENKIKFLLAHHPEMLLTAILRLHISVDGLPLAKSSSSQVWPILGRPIDFPHLKPFIIGIYHGHEKPSSIQEFLKQYVQEMTSLVNNGLEWEGKNYDVAVCGYICDSPARPFMAQIKGHTANYGCGKCIVKGGRGDGKQNYSELDCEKRTDRSFADQTQPEHHTDWSPLLEIPGTKMVTHFPFEYMHLLCLRVMRKMLTAFTKGPRSLVKLSVRQVDNISRFLEGIKCYIPIEFARKTRSLSELARWKATELRLMLLYVGPLVLRNDLRDDVYDHFLSLHFACRVLVSSIYIEFGVQYARDMLKYFVEHFPTLYGKYTTSYNAHGLIHLVDDVIEFGPLDNFSAKS